jgi:hypothetical protein
MHARSPERSSAISEAVSVVVDGADGAAVYSDA